VRSGRGGAHLRQLICTLTTDAASAADSPDVPPPLPLILPLRLEIVHLCWPTDVPVAQVSRTLAALATLPRLEELLLQFRPLRDHIDPAAAVELEPCEA